MLITIVYMQCLHAVEPPPTAADDLTDVESPPAAADALTDLEPTAH